MKKEPLSDIAKRIDAYLKRFEADPKINRRWISPPTARSLDGRTPQSGKRPEGRWVDGDDPAVKALSGGGLGTYWQAGASAPKGATRVYVKYIGYQSTYSLTRTEAVAYLAWLDAGNKGKHTDLRRQDKP